MKKMIVVNYDNVNNLRRGKRAQSWLENRGWTLIKTVGSGTTTFHMIYKKEIKS